MSDSTDIEGIERATLAAVPPQSQETWNDWLLAYDDGTVGRCHSAVPIRHGSPRPDAFHEIASRYEVAGRPLVLRLPEVPTFDSFRHELIGRGWMRATPTSVQIAEIPTAATRLPVEIAEVPDAHWQAAFLGEGTGAADGASRLAILRRGQNSIFATVRVDGQVAAVGYACISHAWCGVHGMRTVSDYRRKGHASAILARLAEVSRERGVTRWFLQVEQANVPALRLYRRWGFQPAWSYAYWRRGLGEITCSQVRP